MWIAGITIINASTIITDVMLRQNGIYIFTSFLWQWRHSLYYTKRKTSMEESQAIDIYYCDTSVIAGLDLAIDLLFVRIV